ncbi:hypothetical protein QAD02_003334 [Eretmocerus hayati]|uniref:Uncharacterized protein n=1 Tax=Eretmocerus hayati TaxID=131215 RepID=A0ACC2NRB2_9HYME|nr:hypothetical protein QAD02_003334 [Eretmocerus hayati]
MIDKYLDELEVKVRSEVDLHRLDDGGENILHQAIKQSGKVEVIEYLENKGAHIHATTRYGSTLSHLANQNLEEGNFPASLKLVTNILQNQSMSKSRMMPRTVLSITWLGRVYILIRVIR